MRRFAQHADKLIPLALVLASFAVYLRTLAPDVVDADGGEFQFAAWNFGFVHPTGYPLFLILGGAFQHLVPIGNPAFRLNLFNALIAACAAAALYLAVNELTRARGAAMLAAASFALTRAFWRDASAAEVYALHAFFVALLLYIALRWQSHPNARVFAAFCFVGGLALTHHRAIVLWVPAFALFFLVSSLRGRGSGDRSQGARTAFYVLRFAFCVLFPLSLYLYIPLRAPASPYYALPFAPGRDLILYDNTLTGFVNYVLGRTFQSELAWDAVSVARVIAFPQLLFDQFGVIGVVLGALGLIAMVWRREWARFVLLLTGFIATILFASLYHIGDIAHYYIPAYLAWAMWLAYGIAWTFHRVSPFLPPASPLLPPASRLLPPASRLLLAAFLLVPQFIVNFPFADRSGETTLREQWMRVLAFAPSNAILISNDRDEMMPLWYSQYVENTRRDVLGLFPLITPAPEHANIARVTDDALGAHRPVYFIKAMPGIEIKYRVAAADGLWRVTEQNRTPQHPSDAVLAARVRVIGYDGARAADALRVAIYWMPRAKLSRAYATFAHLLDARGDKVAQGNDHQVGGAFYPTTLWQVGETLRDEFVIALPPNLAQGNYRLLVGMYSSDELLGEPVEVGAVEIK